MSPLVKVRDAYDERVAADAVVSAGSAEVGERSSMADLLRLMGGDPADLTAAGSIPLLMLRLHAGGTLYHEGSRAQSIYFVRAGTFKSYRTAEDGYEQVLGFAGRAEVLGFGALCAGRHPTSAVALEDSSVYAVTTQDLFTLGQRIPELHRVVHLAASSELKRRDELADLTAPVTTEVRLARFLVHMSQRMAASEQPPRRLQLCMSRRDIARYLGVAHETVSRSFGALSAWDCVRVDNRNVEILDGDRLTQVARRGRCPVDEPRRSTGPDLKIAPAAAQGRAMVRQAQYCDA